MLLKLMPCIVQGAAGAAHTCGRAVGAMVHAMVLYVMWMSGEEE